MNLWAHRDPRSCGLSQLSQPYMGRDMPWAILLFASGSLAIPAPSIFLVPPYPSSQDDPIYISCTAPKDFLGANFTLFRGEEAVQLLQAPSDQPGVTFNVTGGGSEAAGGNFRCQYGVMGEHSQPQLSDLSQSVQVSFPGPQRPTPPPQSWSESKSSAVKIL
ncbi:hypothetical protein U0070_024247 [Myodes glareolus]|uniref:C19orf38 Ig domain-containing protein n=1 Tax=Myodes glareolus TaxID=447135 RepID=A0AAW0HE92_MYOGA